MAWDLVDEKGWGRRIRTSCALSNGYRGILLLG